MQPTEPLAFHPPNAEPTTGFRGAAHGRGRAQPSWQGAARRSSAMAWGLVAAALGLVALGLPSPGQAQAGPGVHKPAKKRPAGKKATPKRGKKGVSKKPSTRRGRKGCPRDMVSIWGGYCIDRYEAYTVELLSRGRVRRHSPFEPVTGKKVAARNRRGRMPQAYISRNEAAQACRNAGKRLCTDEEWVTACKGKRPTLYPYGKRWIPGRCNDDGFSSFNHFFGKDGEPAPQSAYTWENLNDPRLNRPKGTCAPAGKFRRCRNSFRLYDMVGNLHEWTAAPRGSFRGGFFLDVHENGHGCEYHTRAHGPRYHDYSTGFRCCK